MAVDDQVTGIVVSYNTKELMQRAYESVRKFHPNMKIIIVDGSNKNNDCFKYVCSLASAKTRVFHAAKNIGHGRGLCLGIANVETPYFLTFDSDIEMLKSPLQPMLDMFDDNTYGVGYIEKTAFDGHEWGCKPEHFSQGHMRYLHPYFCLIQLKEYQKYKPFIHHGAPAVNTCLDIHRRNLGNKVIKEFDGLGHSSGKGWVWEGKPREFIRHDVAGTRNYRSSIGLEEIEGVWEKVIDPGASGSVTVVTCTGDRPICFSLLEKWMEHQTIQPSQWIVVDDGKDQMNCFPNCDYIRREPQKSDDKQTLLLNIAESYQHIRGDIILFFEDDEYYAPTYIEEMRKKLLQFDIAGIGRSKYYHLPGQKWYKHRNMGHASLAQTGFNMNFFENAKSVLSGDPFYDIRLWRKINRNAENLSLPEKQHKLINGRGIIFEDFDKSLYAGMKGLPGRKGIGAGHSDVNYFNQDKDYQVLKQWIPQDYNSYIDLKLG